MTKQENVLNSNTVQADPILGDLVKHLLLNKAELTGFVMGNGLADEAMYRYAVGKYWAIENTLQKIEELVIRYHKQEELQ